MLDLFWWREDLLFFLEYNGRILHGVRVLNGHMALSAILAAEPFSFMEGICGVKAGLIRAAPVLFMYSSSSSYIYIYVYIAFVPNLSASSFSFTQRGWGKRAIFFESPRRFHAENPAIPFTKLWWKGIVSIRIEGFTQHRREVKVKKTYVWFIFILVGNPSKRIEIPRICQSCVQEKRGGFVLYSTTTRKRKKSCLPDAIKSTATDCITWERRGERWREEENCPADELHHSRCFFTRPSTRFFVTQLLFKSGRCLSRVVKSSKDAREIGFSDVVQLECYSRRERDRQHK